VLSNLLTHSRLATSRRCKREHHLKYNLGYRPVVDAEELFFGQLLHLGLEAWWNSVKAGRWEAEGLNDALAAMRAVKVDPFDLAKAEAMMRGYDARWSDDARHFEVLAVEVKFETAVINPETGHASQTWRLGGKVDVVVRDRRDGKVKFVEHKTSSEDVSQGSVYWRKLLMDGQISIYFDGCASLKWEPEACIYDVLSKPGQRPCQVPLLDELGRKVVLDEKGERVYAAPGKARQTGDKERGFVLQTRDERPDEYLLRCAEAIAEDFNRYFSRGEVVRLEQELNDARFDIWAQGRELRENELAKRAQRNPESCSRNGKLCPFFDVCTGQASIDDQSRFRRVADVHPELVEPAKAA
jgi:hypothetical protein